MARARDYLKCASTPFVLLLTGNAARVRDRRRLVNFTAANYPGSLSLFSTLIIDVRSLRRSKDLARLVVRNLLAEIDRVG